MVCIKLLFLMYLINVIESKRANLENNHLLLSTVDTSNNNIQSSGHSNETKSKVNLWVYYEVLCPASVSFFTQQLRPAVEILAPHLDIRLIPYGHARTLQIRGHYEFRCQHGPAECYGNKLQACVVDALKNNTQAVLFNSCLLQYSAYRNNAGVDYNYIMTWCSYKHHTSRQSIIDCMHNGKGSLLLKKHGDETHALALQYVPYVVVNGSTEEQNDAIYDLIATVCKLLSPKPLVCHTDST